MRTMETSGAALFPMMRASWECKLVISGSPKRVIKCSACNGEIRLGEFVFYPGCITVTHNHVKRFLAATGAKKWQICEACLRFSGEVDDNRILTPAHWLEQFIEDSKLLSREECLAILERQSAEMVS